MSRRRDSSRRSAPRAALLPADLLQRVARARQGPRRAARRGLPPPPNEPLNEAIVRSWNRLVGAWAASSEARAKLPEGDPGTSAHPRALAARAARRSSATAGCRPRTAVEIDGKRYPVSHAWESTCRSTSSAATSRSTGARAGVAGAATQSPHGPCRSCSTAPRSGCGASSRNGLQLRRAARQLVADPAGVRRVRPRAMMDGEVYADFVAALAGLPRVARRGRDAARVLARALVAGGGRSRERARSTACATASRPRSPRSAAASSRPAANAELKDALRSGRALDAGLLPRAAPARLPAAVPVRRRGPRPAARPARDRRGARALRPLVLDATAARPRRAPPRHQARRPLAGPASS